MGSIHVCTKRVSLLCGVNVTLNGLDPGDCVGFMEEDCGWSIQKVSATAVNSRSVGLRVLRTTDINQTCCLTL